jgi:branched-chain amino acid transport system ATP-binding protein
MNATSKPHAGEILLQARGVVKRFGGFQALAGVDFDLAAGERRALIGPNGAGKSTFVSAIGGQLAGVDGELRLRGESLVGLLPHEVARRGVGRSFQISRTFRPLSVHDNMALAVLVAQGLTHSLRPRDFDRVGDEAQALLRDVGLERMADRAAEDISHGDRKRLEFGMALAGRPSLLLLDEPTAGMGMTERNDLMNMVSARAASTGAALLFVEHDFDVVFKIAQRITVMARGKVFAEGTPQEIADHRGVQDIYLGTGH